jgi:hypothetical protein
MVNDEYVHADKLPATGASWIAAHPALWRRAAIEWTT